jgi:ATP-binding cassette subfamily B protein
MGNHKIGFAIVLTAVLIAGIADIGVNYVIKLIFDNLATFENTHENYIILIKLVVVMFILNTLLNVFYRISGFTAIQFFPNMRTEFRSDLFSHLRQHSQRFFANNFAGSLANKINQAGRALTGMYGTFVWELFSGAVFLLLSIVLLWTVSPLIVLVELILLTAYVLITSKLVFKGLPLQKKFSDARSLTTGKLVDSIGNIWNMTSFSAGKREQKRIEEVCDYEAKTNQKSWTYQEWLRTLSYTGVDIIIAVTTMIGVYLWYQGNASIGDIILIITLSRTLATIARQVSQRFVDLSELVGDIKDALDIIGVDHEILDKKNAKKLTVPKGNIQFSNVSFTYPGTTQKVFDDLTITIKPKQRVALVGESGSGKSTFAKLL